MMRRWYNKHMRKGLKGFTIIELSLSIAFIAILSLTVVLIITNAISAYHRGLVLNQINTTGMDLVDDFRAAVQNSPSRSVKSECASIFPTGTYKNYCEGEGGLGFVSIRRIANVKPDDGSYTLYNTPVYGAFCTGSYSYIWNSGYFFTGEHTINNDPSYKPADLTYNLISESGVVTHTWSVDNPGKTFKILKVEDGERAVCKAATRGNKGSLVGLGERYYRQSSSSSLNAGSNVFNITNYNAIEETPVDILEGTKSLALYYLSAAAPADSITLNNMFYSVSFVLGTIQGGINLKASNGVAMGCTAPGDYLNDDIENLDYCAINKFNFAVQANGG